MNMSEPTVQTASEPVILTEKKGYIGYIILNRPKKLNAINWQVYREMIPAIEKMETDDDVKVVVLKGAGRYRHRGKLVADHYPYSFAATRKYSIYNHSHRHYHKQ